MLGQNIREFKISITSHQTVQDTLKSFGNFTVESGMMWKNVHSILIRCKPPLYSIQKSDTCAVKDGKE